MESEPVFLLKKSWGAVVCESGGDDGTIDAISRFYALLEGEHKGCFSSDGAGEQLLLRKLETHETGMMLKKYQANFGGPLRNSYLHQTGKSEQAPKTRLNTF